jgi:hypothetical protein
MASVGECEDAARHWRARYIEAVLDAHAATSEEMRLENQRLAKHYLEMVRCAGREMEPANY